MMANEFDNSFIMNMEKITNPPEKVRLMYEAVAQLVMEQADISTLKVGTITARAGIGKGTAYEYFSSKEELLAYAVTYAYSRKTLELAEVAFCPDNFHDRFFSILDWLFDNKEYYKLLGWSTRGLMGEALSKKTSADVENAGIVNEGTGNACAGNKGLCSAGTGNAGAGNAGAGNAGAGNKGLCSAGLRNCEAGQKNCQIPNQIMDYLSTKIREFMQYGYDQGYFIETDSTKWELALVSSVVEYWFVTMAHDQGLYSNMTEATLREFIYHTLISSLS